MKKLLVFMLILGMASAANATLTWSVSAITLDIDESVVVQIYSDTAEAYGVWAGPSDGSNYSVGDEALITAASPLSAAGDTAAATDKTGAGYPGWWYLEAKDGDPETPPDIAVGNHFDITITGKVETSSTYDLSCDYYGTDDVLEVTVVPEPATIALFGLGGLLLRRRR